MLIDSDYDYIWEGLQNVCSIRGRNEQVLIKVERKYTSCWNNFIPGQFLLLSHTIEISVAESMSFQSSCDNQAFPVLLLRQKIDTELGMNLSTFRKAKPADHMSV